MNKLQLIDADTLYYKPLAHPKMLIDGVLSDGLAILAGDSKIGKSWMVLWLCLQISRGEAVWGLPTRKTDVVYLALEDREWRVQQRMQELTDSPPENLRFGFSCGQLGAELEGQIEETLREFPSTGLIFLDTLQMVRDNASAKVNAYAQDYKDLSGMKKLADDHGICIFVVHHTRKERDNSNTAMCCCPWESPTSIVKRRLPGWCFWSCMTVLTVMTVPPGARDLRHCGNKMTEPSGFPKHRHKRHLCHGRRSRAMRNCRFKGCEAIHRFLIRKDNEHGICVALRHPIPPYLPIRKGRAPVTPLKGCDIYAESNRGNQCAGL